jgi:AcrR family transcriptional regulator
MTIETKSVRSEKSAPRREGPKRSEASRVAILKAAREELSEHGWRNFSADRLAKRARASKQTIYRWWPSIATIAVEAALDVLEDPKSEPGADLNVQLSRLIDPFVQLARAGDGAHLLRSALLAAADDAQAGEVFREWFNTKLRKPLKSILVEAAVRGKIRKDWDIDQASELLFGPVWHRLVMMRGPLPDILAAKSAQGFVQSLRP